MASHEQSQSAAASTGDNLVSNSSDVASVLDKHDSSSSTELLSSTGCSSDVHSGNTGADSASAVRHVSSSSSIPSSHPVTSGNHERIEALLKQKRVERSKKTNSVRESGGKGKVITVTSTPSSDALQVLDAEEKELAVSTSDVITKMQDEIEQGLSFLYENQDLIVKAFHNITQCARMTENADGLLNLCNMSSKQLSTYLPKQSLVHILHKACYYLGLLGRYRVSSKDSEFFDNLITRTGYIDHQANQALVKTILPNLSEAMCTGSKALEIAVYQTPPSDSMTANFWNVFVCIRTTRKICETLERQGYTVKLSRTGGTSGSVLTKATISWVNEPELLSAEDVENSMK